MNVPFLLFASGRELVNETLGTANRRKFYTPEHHAATERYQEFYGVLLRDVSDGDLAEMIAQLKRGSGWFDPREWVNCVRYGSVLQRRLGRLEAAITPNRGSESVQSRAEALSELPVSDLLLLRDLARMPVCGPQRELSAEEITLIHRANRICAEADTLPRTVSENSGVVRLNSGGT